MAKKIKKFMAMVLALCICFSALPLQALAAEDGTVVKGPETTVTDGVKTEVTTTTKTETNPETGEKTVTVTIQSEAGGTKESNGEKVEGSETKTTTTVTETDGDKTVTKVTDGYEKTENIVPDSVQDVTVEVPTTTDDPATAENEGQNTATTPTEAPAVSGNEPSGEEDKNYNYTETTEIPGSVTITTTDVTVTGKVDTENTELDYTMNETAPDGTNDLIHEIPSLAPADRLPGSVAEDPAYPEYPDNPEQYKDYDYVYVGTGNTSQFRPAIVFTKPLTEEEREMLGNPYLNAVLAKAHSPEDLERVAKNEDGSYKVDDEGFYLDENGERIIRSEKLVVGPDGETYYLHRIDALATNHKVEGWYQDGKWVENLGGKKYGVVYATSQQFILVDKETNETIIAYCADSTTETEKSFGYVMENLADATYYSEEEADMIRSIAKVGYWGTVGNETNPDGTVKLDKNGNPVPKEGSLEALKQALLASGEFTEEELKDLTDGVAQTATQMAIWSCSNKMDGVEFVNTHYIGAVGDTTTSKANYTALKDVPADKQGEALLMFRIFEYLKNLEPTKLENNTADTIINADNFVKDMSVTVLEKAKDHENNKDDNKKNDAYVTNLTFALVVEVAEGNEDQLKVSVVDANGNPILNAEGKPVVGRIAGTLEEGEILLENKDGNYCFENIILTEGENTFSLNLEGIQNLKQGVYLYTSEVRDGESSQTLVGKAGGKRAVSVSMNLKFEVDVDDKVVVKEHYWHSEKTTTHTPPTPRTPPEGPNNPPEEPEIFNLNRTDGVIEIPDEQVPLAAAPKTGDNSFLFIGLVLFAAMSLCAVNFGKKRQHETF